MVARTGIKGIGKMVGTVFHRAQAMFGNEVRAFFIKACSEYERWLIGLTL